jgi:hypothetical protein
VRDAEDPEPRAEEVGVPFAVLLEGVALEAWPVRAVQAMRLSSRAA